MGMWEWNAEQAPSPIWIRQESGDQIPLRRGECNTPKISPKMKLEPWFFNMTLPCTSKIPFQHLINFFVYENFSRNRTSYTPRIFGPKWAYLTHETSPNQAQNPSPLFNLKYTKIQKKKREKEHDNGLPWPCLGWGFSSPNSIISHKMLPSKHGFPCLSHTPFIDLVLKLGYKRGT